MSEPATISSDSWPCGPLRQTMSTQRAFWKGKRVLVTGAFGFLGGHLCRAFCHMGATVTALDKDTCTTRTSQLNATGLRDQLEIVEADITDRPGMAKVVGEGNFDFIFHIAAGATVIEKALNAPYDTIMANTMGFVNLAEGARLLPEGKRPVILYSSSDKVYGEAKILPYTEESDLGGAGVYDSAKLCGDIFAGMYHKALGVPTIVLRMCNLIGPYDFNIDYRLIPKALRNIFRDGQGPELYLNALEHFRDYVYVEDAVRAFLMLAHTPACRGRVYNLPGATHIATPEMLNNLVEVVGVAQDNERKRNPDSPFAQLQWNRSVRVVPSDPKLIVISKQNLCGDRILAEAGFTPQVSFRNALENTVRYYACYFCPAAAEAPPKESTAKKSPAKENGAQPSIVADLPPDYGAKQKALLN